MGAIGGAGTALPAFLSRARLLEFFAPLGWIALSLWIRDIIEERFIAVNPAFRQEDPLYWFDTDWTAALLALLVVGIRCLARRRVDKASELILFMAVGWWAAFLILVVGLGLRMTPPRGDSWAGCLGMTLGMLLYFQRNGLGGVTFAALVTGFFGGFGFAAATLVKLIGVTTGWQTNWHSVLEQTYGFLNGVGIAIAMGLLIPRAPRVQEENSGNRGALWPEAACVSAILLLLTYLNLQKAVNDWVKSGAVPELPYLFTARGWFDLGYAALALTFLLLLRAHLRRPLPIVPTGWPGKGQLFYVAFLWWIVIGNLGKAIVAFSPERLVTEGTIFFNALLCTLMALLWPQPAPSPALSPITAYGPLIRRALTAGLAGMLLTTLLEWGIARALYGNRHAGHSGLHIRFGPNATTQPPKPGQPHP